MKDVDHWSVQALCREVGPDIFHPEKGESVREAKQVCSRCPVAAECLAEALALDERFGVRGGLSERERRALRTPRQPVIPAQRQPIDRGQGRPCRRKTRYPSEQAARTAQKSMRSFGAFPISHTHLVACPACDGWHIQIRSAA